MKVLLSIKPEFAQKIFDGSKKYEYRRTIFKNNEITKIVVYASSPTKKVIGEFEIGSILYERPHLLWAKTKEHAGMTKKRFLDYFANKVRGYAIEIKSARMYDTPLALGNFLVSSPPQSFIYL